MRFLRYLTIWLKKIIPKDAQCSETELCILATILRFLVFEIWSIAYSTLVMYLFHPHKTHYFVGRFVLNTPHRRLIRFWIEFLKPTGYRVLLVMVFKPGSQISQVPDQCSTNDEYKIDHI